ncbi:hypothetical protein [Frankia sp. AvcI1]|uniref:hypothetical protein n=1 Tax=Frankia sp. AvcI1 TaxID=573496 RepID=UPI000AE51BE3|nr:hypothetical protein [Frankia sp. AvcI1]
MVFALAGDSTITRRVPEPGVGSAAAPVEPPEPVADRLVGRRPVAARPAAARLLGRVAGTSVGAALAPGLGVEPVPVGSPGSATGAADRAVVRVVVFVRGGTSLLGAACSVR